MPDLTVSALVVTKCEMGEGYAVSG